MLETSNILVERILERAGKSAPFGSENPTLSDLQNQNLFLLQTLLDVINTRLSFAEAKFDLKVNDLMALMLRQLNESAPDFRLQTSHPCPAPREVVLREVWFLTKEDIDVEEEAYGRRDRHQAASGRRADGAGPAGCGCDPIDRRYGSDLLPLAERVRRFERRPG
jgi:hypothetical protein